MRIAFDSNFQIVNSQDLFGRSTLIAQLIGLANRRSCVQLIGMRRFGKTSLLKCLEHHFITDSESNIYPVFVDFKEVGDVIQGTANVYRYLIALAISKLTADGLYTSKEEFRNKEILHSKYWEDVFEDLMEVESIRLPGMFEEILTFFSDLIDKTFLYLFDEYEYLFRFSFDNPTGFMKLRSFSSKRTDKGLNPFFFFISGGMTWDKLCSITGSGELNCIDTDVRVKPLDRPSFVEMWNFESCLLHEEQRINITPKAELAYAESGGVPYYGKIMGGFFVMNNTTPSYLDLKSHLQEVVGSFEVEERDIMLNLSKGPLELTETPHVFELRDNGLISKNGKLYEITIGVLKQYLRSLTTTRERNASGNSDPFKLGISISNLMQSINDTNKNKTGQFIFQPVNDDVALIRDLQTPCSNSDQFSMFASSLYKIVFEKTKNGNQSRGNLPNSIRNSEFVEIVDIMRHSLGKAHLMGTFNLRSGQMTKERMLQILINSRNEPSTPDEYLALQIATLRRFETELQTLNNLVRQLP